jgi:hypothetical protein
LALNDSDEEHDEGGDEKDVDEPAKGIRSHHAKKPENEEYDCNGNKHVVIGD